MADEPKKAPSFLKGGAPKPSAPEPSAPEPAAVPEPAAPAAPSASPFGKPAAAAPAVAAPAVKPAPVMAPTVSVQRPMPAPAAVAAAAPIAAGNRGLAEQHLQRGLDHYDRQEVDQAVQAYQESIAADPSFALAYNNLGMVLIDLERYDEALTSLYESIRRDNSYAEAYNNLGFVLRRLQRNIEAVSAYACFLQLEPEVEEAPRIRSWMDKILGENNLTEPPPFALPAPPPAAKPAPAPKLGGAADPPKIKKMAAWEAAAGDVATAAPVDVLGGVGDAAPAGGGTAGPGAFAAAVAGAGGVVPTIAGAAPAPAAAPKLAQPAQPAAKVEKRVSAGALLPVGGPVGAQPVQGKKPPTPSNPMNTAVVRATEREVVELIESAMDKFADGDLTKAADTFKEVIGVDPNNAEGWAGLGKALIRLEKEKEGIEALQKSIELDPKDPAPYYVLGFALRAAERNIEAAEIYEKFLKLMPKALDAERMKQWVTSVKGVYAASAAGESGDNVAVEEEIVTETDQRYKVALTKFQEDEVDGAMRDAVQILTDEPGHVRTRVLLGRIYLRQKQYDAAMEQLEGSLVTHPDFPEALYFIGQCAEKKGAHDKAVGSYRRYLDVAPKGPRAERLQEWLLNHGTGSGAASGKQVQCELCLRFVLDNEISQYDGKATCRNCMTVMGAAPSLDTPMPVEGSGNRSLDVAPIARGGKGKVVLGLVAVLLLGVGAAWYLKLLDPVLAKIGMGTVEKKPADPIKQPDDPTTVKPPPVVFDPSKVKLTNEPFGVAPPFARWSFAPALTGLDGLSEMAKDWTLEFELKNAPQGMAADGKAVVWVPSTTDFDALKTGMTYSVELTIKGVSGSSENKVEHFKLVHSFNVRSQFGYELTPETDLGISPSERIELAVGDLNGDRRTDAVIASGQFRRGSVRMYIQRPENPLPLPTIVATGARHSAVHVADLDGNLSDDLLVANWQAGQIRPYFQEAGQPAPGIAINVGAGPIAFGVGDLDGDKRPEIGVLLGVGKGLAVTTVSPNRKFDAIVTVPMPSGGANGFVFPWKSADGGPGFVAVTPLAENPLQFVPHNKGKWTSEGGTVVASGLAEPGLIIAAAALPDRDGAPRLALMTGGKTTKIHVYGEKSGKFTPIGQPQVLPGTGLGLVAHDFNDDGKFDVFVVGIEDSGFYFTGGQDGFAAGPQYKTIRMSGVAAAMQISSRDRPDILLVTEARKAQILKVVIPDAVAPTPTPNPEEKRDTEKKSGESKTEDKNEKK